MPTAVLVSVAVTWMLAVSLASLSDLTWALNIEVAVAWEVASLCDIIAGVSAASTAESAKPFSWSWRRSASE